MGKQHSREYETLLNNIPGGVQQCLNDRFFTLVEVNQGFLDLFGFSRDEITEQFHDRFIDMIHPADRRGVLAKTEEQFCKDRKFTFNYRVLCKNGSFKWVMDNAQIIHNEEGEERIFCILLDITESRKDREELRLSLERHRIILNQTTDIIFEWDIEKDSIFYSANWQKKFGYDPNCHITNRDLSFARHVHPDDISVLKRLMSNAKAGMSVSDAEIRIQNADGIYIWCRIRYTDQYDSTGKPIKAVGVITDIDDDKKMIDDLRARAERDALTGLFNREESERKIRNYLRDNPGDLCALFMIDTDNFKQVNDSQGHLFGDAVLSELAAGMKKLTRQTDVVGRIGGDEFMIFLQNIPSREMAAEKAARLLELFQGLFKQGKHPIEVTCSAGIAISPDDGKDFQSLYHSADLALYQAKSQGKNQYVMFDQKHSAVSETGYSSLGAAIDSDLNTSEAPKDLVNYVFQVLYDTSDIDHVIQLILEIVGKRFDVSRAYIFEDTEDGKYCDNTYEWCNEGILPQKENLQHFPYTDVEGYRELFKNNSVFYCRDIHALTPVQTALFEDQGICSTLQCAILEGEAFHGFVGFDECTGMRLWNKEEIATLTLISQLLTTFLLKKRTSAHDSELAIRLNTILDTQDAYIYAIERDTYELLYLNLKTRELAPHVKPGTACYEAFFDREVPCNTCPLAGGVGEIYNPLYGVWTRAKGSPMKWGELDAYLLTCFDITEYKKMQ